MSHIANHDVEPKHMQADVISRRTESKFSTYVSEFRLIILVGILVAILASLFFAGAPAAVQVFVGSVVGVAVAVVARVTRRI